MQQGIFEKSITVTPDYCDAAAQLSPLAAFTIFQGIAAQHAELIGVGGAAMAKRGEFWLTVHTRVDFLRRAGLMDELTAATWPEPCGGRAVRCYRSYSLHRGGTLLALQTGSSVVDLHRRDAARGQLGGGEAVEQHADIGNVVHVTTEVDVR